MIETEVWVGIGVDPITQSVYAIGIGESEEKCKEQQVEFEKNGDWSGEEATYFKIFQLSEKFGKNLFDWLVKCGIPSSQAGKSVQSYGKKMLGMMNKIEKEKKGV